MLRFRHSPGRLSSILSRDMRWRDRLSLWEGVILAAAVGLCLRLVRKTTARLRFTIWILVFVVLVALPLLSELLANQPVAVASLSAAPHLQLDPRWSYALAALWLGAITLRFAYFVLQAMKLRSL